MIYVDSSVVLAQLLAEHRAPPTELAQESLASSRLLQYEVWTRLHSRGFAQSHGSEARAFLDRIALVELSTEALARVLDPFPVPVRTLDAIHLATADFLRREGREVRLATYDKRLLTAAQAMQIELYPM